MSNLDAWAPHLQNPLTLTAFITLLGGIVLLGLVRYAMNGKKLIAAIATVFITGAAAGLLLAAISVYKKKDEEAHTTSDFSKQQSVKSKNENPPTINIQMANGSNNILTNNQEKRN